MSATETAAGAVHVPERVTRVARQYAEARARAAWTREHDRWGAAHPDVAASFPLDRVPSGPLDEATAELADGCAPGGTQATRRASGAALLATAGGYPALVGGSAELAASTNTALPGGDVGPGEFAGRTSRGGVSTGWRALAGPQDVVVGIDRSRASGPGAEVAGHLGLSPGAVARAALGVVGRSCSVPEGHGSPSLP